MKDEVSPSHRYHTFVLLMLSGGFMGAYSYFLKGGVFANAETANLLILALNIAECDVDGAVAVLIPISAFFIGTFFSQMFIEKLGRLWIPILLGSEIVLLLLLSFLPSDNIVYGVPRGHCNNKQHAVQQLQRGQRRGYVHPFLYSSSQGFRVCDVYCICKRG